MTLEDKAKYVENKIETDWVHMSKPWQIEWCYHAVHDYGASSSNDIEETVWINTLIGYDIGYERARAIANELEATKGISALELTHRDRNLVDTLAGHLGFRIDFTGWATSYPDWTFEWGREEKNEMDNVKFHCSINDELLNVLISDKGNPDAYKSAEDYTVASVELENKISVEFRIWNINDIEEDGNKPPQKSLDVFICRDTETDYWGEVGESQILSAPTINWASKNWKELLKAQMTGVLYLEYAKQFAEPAFCIEERDKIIFGTYNNDRYHDGYVDINGNTSTLERLINEGYVDEDYDIFDTGVTASDIVRFARKNKGKLTFEGYCSEDPDSTVVTGVRYEVNNPAVINEMVDFLDTFGKCGGVGMVGRELLTAIFDN